MKDTKRFKLNLELFSPGDGRIFLNFWNHFNGDDVVCQLRDGKLYIDEEDEESGELEITFQQFVDTVKARAHSL